MSSSAIQKLLEERNYFITIDEYKEIIQSPQLTYISYNHDDDSFEIRTYDGNIWAFRVEK